MEIKKLKKIKIGSKDCFVCPACNGKGNIADKRSSIPADITCHGCDGFGFLIIGEK
jgi:DnaJ-class molecular chaperone